MYEIDPSRLDNPSLGNILQERARRDGDETFLLFEDGKVTCADFNEQANRAANGLLDLGVRKGDTVCLYLPNCPAWMYLWLGMAKMGAVLVPVMPGLSGTYLSHLINQSDAETVIVHSSFLGAFNGIAHTLEKVKNVIVDADDASGETVDLPRGAVRIEQLLDSSGDPPRADVRYPDVSHIIFTSGTTGYPKGLVVRHDRPGRPRGGSVSETFGLYPGDVAYTCYPLPSCFTDFIGCLIAGMPVAFSREKRFDRFWDDIRRYNVAAFNYFADLIPALLDQPEKEDDADNPARICTGIMAPREPGVVPGFEKRFGVRVVETYGTVEGGNVTENRPYRTGSIGKPVPGVEVKIVDSEGNEVEPHVVGEIVHRRTSGEPIAVEYYKMPAESAAKTLDGWYHSDDLAYKDEDGYLYFVDRKLDMIKKDGRQIPASAIESVVAQHDKVSECVAVGVPCGSANDDIKLCVVCKEGTRLTPEELIRFCADNMDDNLLPRYIQFRSSLPRSSRGKAQRFKLQAEGVPADTWDRYGAHTKA
jgi:crotonobetaine/carnitine-CoA ligase